MLRAIFKFSNGMNGEGFWVAHRNLGTLLFLLQERMPRPEGYGIETDCRKKSRFSYSVT